MFTVFLERHADIWEDLLANYFPDGASVIDFTYGTGALHWNLIDKKITKYRITKCDKEPSEKIPDFKEVHVKDILTDEYADLGVHDAALYDPRYLIGRDSFDYSTKVTVAGHLQQGFYGPRSWSSTKLSKYVYNQSIADFNQQVSALNLKCPAILKNEGLLFVKVMDVRYKGKLVPHHFNIFNLLTNFELIDHGIYIRQGATTWKIKGHLQNLHGHWMIFKKKESFSSVPNGKRAHDEIQSELASAEGNRAKVDDTDGERERDRDKRSGKGDQGKARSRAARNHKGLNRTNNDRGWTEISG